MKDTNLLIIGAGPYGLGLAAYVQHLGIDHIIVGKSMSFWKMNMPRGMCLRSGVHWHLDPFNLYTIEKFLEVRNQSLKEMEPLSLEFYLSYVRWFQEQRKINALPLFVQQLDYINSHFQAILEDGEIIRAKQIVIAIGFQYFKYLPPELIKNLTRNRYSHTCDFIDFSKSKGCRYLIVGGRQSAFEWGALINEANAACVHICYRHETPQFKASKWEWADSLIAKMLEKPCWYRDLSKKDKDDLNNKFWMEGRLKLEPWLEPRIMQPAIKLWPKTFVTVDEQPNGELMVKTSSGKKFVVDHVILATGYKVKIHKVPFLMQGNLLPQLKMHNGYPVLDINFQTNIPKLFITSLAASQDFGLFFGFTISVRASTKLIGMML